MKRRRTAPSPHRPRLASMLCLAACLAPTAPGATAHATGEGGVWWSAGHIDYAPSGLPDFSQCRGAWSRAGSPPRWTHAGPVALADALWWLDSVAEPEPRPPTDAHDGHALVTAYPDFGPARDDHDPANFPLLVEDLALRAASNGAGPGRAHLGTTWEDLVGAAESYLGDRRLAARYSLRVTTRPDATWLGDAARDGAGTVVLLGVWQVVGGAWQRVGGHYAAVAGIGGGATWLALADPLGDSAGFGAPGRAVPPDATRHGCRDAPRAHDDAGVVSHDRYEIERAHGLPGERSALTGYFTPQTYGDAAAFRGQNTARFLAAFEGTWSSGAAMMALDAALAIVPAGPTASPTTVPSAMPTLAPTPSQTATATASPTPDATAAPGTPAPGPTRFPLVPTERFAPAPTTRAPRLAAFVPLALSR